MTPPVRKLALVAHVTCSIGWLGAVAAFFALALAGLTSDDAQLARGAYLAMAVVTTYVIVPSSIAALVTGLVSSFFGTFGVVRHYWVIAKLVLTVGAVALLLVHTQPIDILAAAAAERALAGDELRELRVQVTADSGAALIVLLLNTVLGVFKPRGLTRYGWRHQQQVAGDVAADEPARVPRWVPLLGIAVVALLVVLKGSTVGFGKHGPGMHGGHSAPSDSTGR